MKVYLRVANRLVREPHLPRPLRWLLVFALLPIPGPADDLALLLAAMVIAVFYRNRFQSVLAEEREPPAATTDVIRARLLARGRSLELMTLAWNVVGIVVLAVAALEAKSVALAGFGLDSLIEIGASIVVLWELTDVDQSRQRHALRLIGGAFVPSPFI